MIEIYRGKKEQSLLLNAIVENNSEDFFYTENNQRVNVDSIKTLKKLLSDSCFVYCDKEGGAINGAILVWKSCGGDTVRNYVKVSASSPEEVERLLTVLLWNIKKPLFVKVHKGSPVESVYRRKGFRFAGGRGNQVLLKREAYPIRTDNNFKKDEEARELIHS